MKILDRFYPRKSTKDKIVCHTQNAEEFINLWSTFPYDMFNTCKHQVSPQIFIMVDLSKSWDLCTHTKVDQSEPQRAIMIHSSTNISSFQITVRETHCMDFFQSNYYLVKHLYHKVNTILLMNLCNPFLEIRSCICHHYLTMGLLNFVTQQFWKTV